MRPRLGEDVRYVPSSQGVYLHNGTGEATLRGKHSYEWLRRLAPYLTGERELTEALPTAARQMVTDLVGMLYQQGFVTDARADLARATCRPARTRRRRSTVAVVRRPVGTAARPPRACEPWGL
jgi:hypothetical protein